MPARRVPSGAQTNEEPPATDSIPQKVIDDCLAKLKTQIPDREMEVISARRGEASFIVDVEVGVSRDRGVAITTAPIALVPNIKAKGKCLYRPYWRRTRRGPRALTDVSRNDFPTPQDSSTIH